MTDNKKPIINHQDLADINQEIDQVLDTLHMPSIAVESDKLVIMSQKMKQPQYLMQTQNKVSGIYLGRQIELEVDIDFALDTTTLIKAYDNADKPNLDALVAQAQTVGGDEYGKELAQVVTEAIVPHALGVTQSVNIKKIHATDLDGVELTNVHLPKSGFVIMEAKVDGVWFDYSIVLTPLNQEGEALLLYDHQMFRENLVLAIDIIAKKASSKQEYHWQDQGKGYELDLIVTADFKPL